MQKHSFANHIICWVRTLVLWFTVCVCWRRWDEVGSVLVSWKCQQVVSALQKSCDQIIDSDSDGLTLFLSSFQSHNWDHKPHKHTVEISWMWQCYNISPVHWGQIFINPCRHQITKVLHHNYLIQNQYQQQPFDCFCVSMATEQTGTAGSSKT